MGAYDSLKSLVRQYIKTNGQNEITGQILQNVLIAMIDDLGITIDQQPTNGSPNAVASGGVYNAIKAITDFLNNGYYFVGIAGTSTVPDSVTQYGIFYIASNGGTYTNFLNGDDEPLTLYQGLNILYKDVEDDGWNYFEVFKFSDFVDTTQQQSLSSQQKAQARTNIAAVSYEQQSLSDAQKVQAQNNMMGKAYSSVAADHSGLGKVYLDKNNGVLTQDMINAANTVYVIQYDYTLTDKITIPANCTLEFDGGSISGSYTLTGQDTYIDGDNVQFNCVLAGTYSNEIIHGEWFGVKSGSGNAASNDAIFANYLVPTLENISPDYPYKPITLHIETSFYINNPIIFSGKFNVNMVGILNYGGGKSTTALTIGRESAMSREREYSIYTIAGNTNLIKENDTINDYVGLKMVNIYNSKIHIDFACSFSYPILFLAKDYGFGNNIIEFNNIGKEAYTALKLVATGTGWMNENLFICGSFTNYSSNPCHDEAIGIEIDASEAQHIANGNLFIKPNIENQHVGLKLSNAQHNNVIGARIENVSVPMLCTDTIGYMYNSITYGDNVNLNVPRKMSSAVSPLENLTKTSLPLLSQDSCYQESVKTGFSISNLDGVNSPWDVFFGHFFEVTSSDNIIRACVNTSRSTCIFGFFLYDQNGDLISSANAASYLENVGAFKFTDTYGASCLWTTGDTTEVIISVKSTVSKIFVGVYRTQMPDSISMYGLGVKLSKYYNYPSGEAGNLNTIEILKNVKWDRYYGFYDNTLTGKTLVLYGDIDLDGQDTTICSNMRIVLKGGRLKNGYVRINGAVIEGDYNNLLGDNCSLTGSTTPAIGTYRFQNGKPNWWDGNNWVDGGGNIIS